MRRVRIALLHLAPRVGDLEYNRQLVETALTTAAGCGAAWIVTPELWLCGYQFSPASVRRGSLPNQMPGCGVCARWLPVYA